MISNTKKTCIQRWEEIPVQPGDGWWWLGGRDIPDDSGRASGRQINLARMGMFEIASKVGSHFGWSRIKKITHPLSPKQFHPLFVHPERQIHRYPDCNAQRSYEWNPFHWALRTGCFRNAIHLLRWPSHILFLWFLSFMTGYISQTLSSVFQPLASSPAFHPQCAIGSVLKAPKDHPSVGRYPKLVEVSKQDFRRVVDGTVGGSTLSLEIKKAEMATSICDRSG